MHIGLLNREFNQGYSASDASCDHNINLCTVPRSHRATLRTRRCTYIWYLRRSKPHSSGHPRLGAKVQEVCILWHLLLSALGLMWHSSEIRGPWDVAIPRVNCNQFGIDDGTSVGSTL